MRAEGENSVGIRKSLVRVWVVLSLISILIDVACFWLVQHTPAQLPGTYTVNYITTFLVSVSAPFGLALLLTILGCTLALLRWASAGVRRAARRTARSRRQSEGQPLRDESAPVLSRLVSNL